MGKSYVLGQVAPNARLFSGNLREISRTTARGAHHRGTARDDDVSSGAGGLLKETIKFTTRRIAIIAAVEMISTESFLSYYHAYYSLILSWLCSHDEQMNLGSCYTAFFSVRLLLSVLSLFSGLSLSK